MKTRPIAVALLLALTPATLTVVRPAFAQADDPTTRAARARFQEGVEFFDKGQFENARASFLQAYALRKHPAVLLNLAQSCLRSGHALEAAKYFQQYLRESTSLTASQRNDAERGLTEARMKLGRVVIDAPAGQEIFVDDERIGVTPLRDPIDVEPGTHTVKARGRTDETVAVNAAAGQQATAHFGPQSAVTPLPPPTTPTPAPSAEPTAPPPEPPPSEPAAQPTASEATTADSGVSKPGRFAPPKYMAPVYLGGAVALAGFGTAIGMGLAKTSAQNSADSVATQIRAAAADPRNGYVSTSGGPCSPNQPPATAQRFAKACAALDDDNNKVNQDATIANVALGVGVVATVFTAAWWLFSPKNDGTSASWKPPMVAPMIGNGTGGMTVVGSF